MSPFLITLIRSSGRHVLNALPFADTLIILSVNPLFAQDIGGIVDDSPPIQLDPNNLAGSVYLEPFCTYVDPNGVTHYIADIAVNGRWDNYDSFVPFPEIPGFSITSFSIPTASSANSPPTAVPFSIGSGTPVGVYQAYLIADGSEIMSQIYCTDKNFSQTAAYNGTFEFDMNSILSPPIRSSFTTFTVSGAPATSLTSATEHGWNGPNTPTESALTSIIDTTGIDPGTEEYPNSCVDQGQLVTVCPTATVSPMSNVGTSGTFTISPPANPIAGVYSPGQLTFIAYAFAYGTPGSMDGPLTGEGAIGAAGTTAYITTAEDTFQYPPNCESIRYTNNHGKVVTKSGSESGSTAFPNNPAYASGVFCKAWVYFLGLNGSGLFLNPAYSWAGTTFHFLNNIVTKETPLQGSDGYVLHPEYGMPGDGQQSIARDEAIIPKTPGAPDSAPYMVTLYDAAGDLRVVAQATDTGGAFMSHGQNGGAGYSHFDVYLGVSHTVNQPFANPMVLYGCNTPPPPPHVLASEYTTLCPSISDFNSIVVSADGRRPKRGGLAVARPVILRRQTGGTTLLKGLLP